MLTRRKFSLFAIATLGSPNFAFAAGNPAIADDELPPLPKDLLDAAGEEDFFSLQLESTALGTADPGKARKEMALAILDAAPKDCRPIEVAFYFRDLGQGKTSFGEEGRPFARGWPRIYNPLIIEFFKVTGLNPLAPGLGGDATPWCAAFVNYCIARAVSKNGKVGPAELAKGTNSASSGSFRCFGNALPAGSDPKEGDIAVWALAGTLNACKPGSGHVGFFVGHTKDDRSPPYFVVGGNQGGDLVEGVATRKDGVFLKKLPEKYLAERNPPRYKEFLSFRTASYL